jgi:hypothetical protein
VRYFFRSHIPDTDRVLVIESGSRQIVEQIIPTLRRMRGDQVQIDVVTCYAGEPSGLQNARIYNVNDYDGAAGRDRLLGELRERQYPIIAVLCSAEPIMTKWKWWLGAKIPSKILIFNENGDCFWLDWAHFHIVREFAGFRLGLTGAALIPALVRLVFFPVILIYLLLYAVAVHARRLLRPASI